MTVFLLDNGSKYLIELNTLLEKYGRVTVSRDRSLLTSFAADIVVLSGGHHHSIIKNPDIYQAEIDFIRNTAKPVLGICLGAEIIAYAFGATLTRLDHEEKGLKDIRVLKNDSLFTGISGFRVYESHKWAITGLPDSLEGLAGSESGYEIIRHITRPVFGFQFHPEMFEDKSCGDEIFTNLFNTYLKQ